MKGPLTLFLILSIYFASAQNPERTFPQNYFRPPLDIAPQASGSFGELRANHFHTGTDYRTNQREGYPVYAVADGFISRARVQIGGGGNALYIDHPNGYTSVYMHLQKFNNLIATTVKNKQYENQQFDVDFPPGKNVIQVKKGDIIAYSGNTGGSAGPHLHFEIRDTKTEETINPQLFGLTIPDAIPPTITSFTIFRLGEAPFSENTPREHFQVTGSNGKYHLPSTNVITVNGNTGFGIAAVDRNSASANQNGIYSVELSLDGKTIYHSAFTGLFFNHNRALNSYIDFATYIFKSQRIQKSFVEPGNPLTIYSNLVNNGLIDLKDDKIHELLYQVKDIKGNTSSLSFSVRYDPSLVVNQNLKSGTSLLPYNKVNIIKKEDILIDIPANSLYSDLNFLYSKSAKPASGYSEVHHIHNRMIPLHSAYTLSIKANPELTPALQSKALFIDSRGFSAGGTYKDGYVTGNVLEFGNFYIGVDTQAPVIRALNISENKVMTGVSQINLKISDNLSGIKSFNGYIDDQWVLMQYDSKTASLWHTFESNLTKGKHTFKLIVKDAKDNERIYQVNFSR